MGFFFPEESSRSIMRAHEKLKETALSRESFRIHDQLLVLERICKCLIMIMIDIMSSSSSSRSSTSYSASDTYSAGFVYRLAMVTSQVPVQISMIIRPTARYRA